jgi:hypothetical protein
VAALSSRETARRTPWCNTVRSRRFRQPFARTSQCLTCEVCDRPAVPLLRLLAVLDRLCRENVGPEAGAARREARLSHFASHAVGKSGFAVPGRGDARIVVTRKARWSTLEDRFDIRTAS